MKEMFHRPSCSIRIVAIERDSDGRVALHSMAAAMPDEADSNLVRVYFEMPAEKSKATAYLGHRAEIR